VIAGAAGPGVQPAPSEAAQAIVAEALRDDPRPLYFTCGGPLSNLAAALRLEPAIAARMTVVWIGGGPWPEGGWEYNLATDADAARYVIEQSTVPMWQVPQNAYRQMQYSIAEMTADLRPISDFSRWLAARRPAAGAADRADLRKQLLGGDEGAPHSQRFELWSGDSRSHDQGL
jgi:inosine-uridine nucleoside N-ribohydrolase